MVIIETRAKLAAALAKHWADARSIGFVPTMGYLHEGHLSLVRRCRSENDISVVSIFVNPAQFGPNMDLDRYPRDLKRDRELLEKEGAQILFTPGVEEIYPPDYSTWVEVGGVTELLDGASRPGYFRGIATVVLKLFHMVQPTRTYFGQKDLQQALMIGKLIRDLHLEIELSIMPTVRESDGLAMSSRNSYLSADDRKVAPLLYQGLQAAKKFYERGERSAEKLIAETQRVISAGKDFEIDYIEIVDLKSVQKLAIVGDSAFLALAVNLNGTRLIDNIILSDAGSASTLACCERSEAIS